MPRYKSDNTIRGNSTLSTPKAMDRLRAEHAAGRITTRLVIIGQGTRLDHLAFKHLGNPSYWWAIAALSKIGWSLQLPAGTALTVPTNIDQIRALE